MEIFQVCFFAVAKRFGSSGRYFDLILCRIVFFNSACISPVKITKACIHICRKGYLFILPVANLGNIFITIYPWLVQAAFHSPFSKASRSCTHIGNGMFYRIQRNIAGFGSIEPSSPEPVKVFSAGIFHCSEKVCRFGMFKGPSPGVLFKCVVEKLAAHYRFAQDV